MEKMKMKTVGVVGGVGPEASNNFCELLIKNTPAKKDQDNIPFLHFCNPQIPDRTGFIIGNGESPVAALIETSKALERAGADFLIIPCNTAHYFLSQVQDNISIPIVDMTKILVKGVLSSKPKINKIGILATTGSIKAEIYQNYFMSVGIEPILLSLSNQKTLVMDAIYGEDGIKAGNKIASKEKLRLAAENLIKRGAEGIVLGCTEIPLVLKQEDFGIRLYDPMELAAREIVEYVKEEENRDIVSVRFALREFAESIGRVFAKENDFVISEDTTEDAINLEVMIE